MLEGAIGEGRGDEGEDVNGALEKIAKRLEGQVVTVRRVVAHFLEVGGDGDGLPGSAVLTAGSGLGVEHEGAKIVLGVSFIGLFIAWRK